MSIAKNTLHYSLALVYQKILGFIYFAVIARSLGVEQTGLYVFALSFTTIFSVLADIGFAPVLTREVAKDNTQTQTLFSQVFSVKIFISSLTYLLVILFVNWLDYPELTRQLVYVAGVVMLLDSFSLIFWAVFRGTQQLKYEAIGVIGHQTITVILGLTALSYGLNVMVLLFATLLGSLFYALYSLSWILKKLKLKLKLVFDKTTVSWFIKMALPFALAGVFARIYTQIDTVMLSKLGCSIQAACDQNVGWYGTASKVTLALQFIPLALAASLFPAFSEQHAHNPEKLRATYQTAWRYLALMVLPLTAGVIALAPEIVKFVWGADFLPAALPLQILMGSLIFLFLTFPNGSLLNAVNKQLLNTYFMGIAVLVNVLLNIYLILRWQMTGAAIASMVSTFTLFLLGFIKSYKLIRFNIGYVSGNFIKILASSLIMYGLLIVLKSGVHFLMLIPIGALVYFITGYLLRAIGRDDFKLIKLIFNKPKLNQ